MTLHPALPEGSAVSAAGILHLGGCACSDLAEQFGTPLYVYELQTLRMRMRAVRAALGPYGSAHYAAKAYLARWLLHEVETEGLGLDVSSEGELRVALAAHFPAERIRLHGNNKQEAALRLAVEHNIGAVVVDNLSELRLLLSLSPQRSTPIRLLLRLNPGIEAHTHRYLQTGVNDSKFGIPIGSDELIDAVRLCLAHRTQVRLLGYHAHIGTQILDLEPYGLLMRTLLAVAASIEADCGFWPTHLSPGGGAGIAYTDEAALPLDRWISTLLHELDGLAASRRPQLSVEPGRALVGPAGVALYRVGTIKPRPSGRRYVCVDGGMADNIRPALYQAAYTALAATRMHQPPHMTAALAGPYCESGDILVQEATFPALQAGDIIAVPAAGAYCLPMSSNYNGALRPAVVTVDRGVASLVQRRQTVEDLLALDR